MVSGWWIVESRESKDRIARTQADLDFAFDVSSGMRSDGPLRSD